MIDKEKNRKVIEIIGIKRARRVEKEVGGDAVYFKAVIHQWVLDQIEKRLRRNQKEKEIARREGVSIRTVGRRKKIYLGI